MNKVPAGIAKGQAGTIYLLNNLGQVIDHLYVPLHLRETSHTFGKLRVGGTLSRRFPVIPVSSREEALDLMILLLL